MKWFVLPVVLFLAVGVSGITLSLSFGDGVTHYVEEIEVTTGAPNIETDYCFTSSGVSTSSGDAFVVSEATETGIIAYEEYFSSGDCDWTVYVNTTAVGLDLFDGYSVNSGDKIKWCTSPNNVAVMACVVSMDYNIMVV